MSPILAFVTYDPLAEYVPEPVSGQKSEVGCESLAYIVFLQEPHKDGILFDEALHSMTDLAS